MILGFKCAETEILFQGYRVPRFRNIETVARRKLRMLDQAQELAGRLLGLGGRWGEESTEQQRDHDGDWSHGTNVGRAARVVDTAT